MKLWPSDRWVLQVTAPVDGVAAVVARNTVRASFGDAFRESPGRKTFRGEASERTFKISRTIGYQNSFLPVLVGTIIETAGGCRVEVHSRMHPLVNAFTVLWLGMGAGITLPLMLTLRDRAVVIGPLVLLGGYALMQGGFWPEARRAKAVLIELIERAGYAVEERSVAAPASDSDP